MNPRFYYPFLSLVLVALILSACGPTATDAPAPTEEPATAAPTEAPTSAPTEAPAAPLTVLIDNDEGPITPANFNTFIGFWMVGWVYDSLYIRTPDLEPIPSLAASATPSEDGLTWTVALREGVKWHDGEDFDVDDVIFSYNFLIAAGRASNLAAIDTLEKTGDYSLTIHLKEPQPFFLNEGLAGSYVLPEHIWNSQTAVSGELSQFQGMVGTGAYRLVEVEPAQFYRFEANPDYFRGEPVVNEIIAKIVKDRTQQFNQLQTGEADAVLSSVPPAVVGELEGNADLEIAKGSDFFNYIFYTNGSREPFDDPAVRQAIAKAIDTKTLVEVVLLGQGVELPLNWYHPDLPWSINVPHVYDPAAASAELEAAGLDDSDGDGIRELNGANTDFGILCDVNNPVEVRATELIAGMLGEVGIGATQNCLDIDSSVALIWPNFVAVAEPDYDMGIWGWSSGPQFQRGFIKFLTNCEFGTVGWGNLTGICDPTLDELVDLLTANTDPSKTEEYSTQLQQRFVENLPFIPLMSPGGNFAFNASAYDGWVYMKGTGIMTVWSFLPEGAVDIP